MMHTDEAIVAPVSVVIPCFRCDNVIVRAVQSVASQTLPPAEVILIDDASGDNTASVLKLLKQQYGEWVRLVQLPTNVGAASARNIGWNMAGQPYIAFLDADDAWHPKKIEIQYGYMKDNPGVMLSGHLCRELPEGSSDTLQWSAELKSVKRTTLLGLLLKHQFVTPSVMLRKEIPFRFAEGKRYMEDHLLWLEIISAPMLMIKLQVDLAAVYKPNYGSSGLSANLWGMEKGELSNYQYLYNRGKIAIVTLLLLQCYSLAKFMKRLIVVYLVRRI